MDLGRRLLRSPTVQRVLGRTLAGYLKLVHRTSRIVHQDPLIRDFAVPNKPVIVALWHGQHLMVPLVRPPEMPFAVLLARHADAEVNAIAISRLGLGTVRASGAHRSKDVRRKGGAAGFLEMLSALGEGISMALTADVPRGPAKQAGRGIILLAQHSGRPILPLAYASSRRLDVSSWDSASVNLPFSRAAIVCGEPILVPKDSSDMAIEALRRRLTASLDAATAKAYAIVDGTTRAD